MVVPAVAIHPPAAWDGVDDALDRLASYHWVLFTSASGVETFFARIEGTQVSLEAAIAAPDGRRIETAAGKGLITDAEGLGRSLAEDLLSRASDLILEAQER